MGTVDEVLAQARLEIGVTESPAGSNMQKFAAEAGHANGERWCATFLVAIMRRCGVRLPSESAGTEVMAAAFKQDGSWFTSSPHVGDLVFFKFSTCDADRTVCHVALVEEVEQGGLQTIEGNTDAGGSANGGAVMRRQRHRDIVGFGRPDYGPPIQREEDNMQMIPNYKPDGALHYFYVADGGDLFHAWWRRTAPFGRNVEHLAVGSKFDGQPAVTVDGDDTIHIVCDRPGAQPPGHVFRKPGAEAAWAVD